MPSDPRIVHELDQMEAVFRDLAPVLGSIRDRLMEQGYTREEAVEGSFRVLEVLMGQIVAEVD